MGIFPTHSGITGKTNVLMDFVQSVILSALSMMAEIANVRGMTRNSSSIMVIAATARPRFCQNQPCSFSNIGHVATTIMVAQIKELRNGLKIQKLAAISAPMNSTERVTRVISREVDVFIFVTSFLLSSYLHIPRPRDCITMSI
jgi:predicted cation transporter